MTQYENIIFLQGSEVDAILKGICRKGEESVIDYLAQWYNPGEHEVTETIGNSSDTYYTLGLYTLVYNTAYEYVGLYCKI